MPSCLAAVASILAVNSTEIHSIHAAAVQLLGPDFAAQFSVEALRKAARDILKATEGQATPPTLGTYEALIQTHTAARLAEQTAMQDVDEVICLQLLELLCMSEHGSRCAELLSNGGTYLACAIIAAVYSIVAPPAEQHGPRLLMCLSRLSSFPPDVITVHAQIVLQATVVCQSQG